jgi:hypothetical protein
MATFDRGGHDAELAIRPHLAPAERLLWSGRAPRGKRDDQLWQLRRGSGMSSLPPSFELIPAAKQVYDLIRQAQRSS